MSESSLNRRNFHELIAAAIAGVIAAESVEAQQPGPQDEQPQRPGQKGPPVKKADVGNPLLQEPNVCRGLNTCKGKGRGGIEGGPNACAGTSVCATAPAHICAGHNTCRGLGACDQGTPGKHEIDYPGENTCKARGACGVPVPIEKDVIWRKARMRFETLMADAGKKFGPAPPRPQ
jgi:hypothetical protein